MSKKNPPKPNVKGSKAAKVVSERGYNTPPGVNVVKPKPTPPPPPKKSNKM